MNLSSLLSQQQEQLDALLALLKQEQDELVQGGPDGKRLVELSNLKKQHLEAIESLETSRRALQIELGYAPGLKGTEQATRAGDCLALWQTVQDTARRAAHLNQVNGSLIRQRLEHNLRALNSLREISGNVLYGADGQARSSGSKISSSA